MNLSEVAVPSKAAPEPGHLSLSVRCSSSPQVPLRTLKALQSWSQSLDHLSSEPPILSSERPSFSYPFLTSTLSFSQARSSTWAPPAD